MKSLKQQIGNYDKTTIPKQTEVVAQPIKRAKSKYDEWNANNKQEIVNHINKHHSIYLYGKYGTGKTHFLYWLSKKYQEQGASIYISMMGDINRKIKQEINDRKNDIYNKSEETKMRECTVLCIDDLGNEYMTQFVHEVLSTVINYRYINNLPTFITSNYTLKELYNVYSQSVGETKAGQIVSRVMKFGAIKLDAINYRKELDMK